MTTLFSENLRMFIASEMKRLGLTATDLSQRFNDLGRPTDKTAISRQISGSRGIGPEWLALYAAALQIPEAQLAMLYASDGSDVEIKNMLSRRPLSPIKHIIADQATDHSDYKGFAAICPFTNPYISKDCFAVLIKSESMNMTYRDGDIAWCLPVVKAVNLGMFPEQNDHVLIKRKGGQDSPEFLIRILNISDSGERQFLSASSHNKENATAFPPIVLPSFQQALGSNLEWEIDAIVLSRSLGKLAVTKQETPTG